MRGHGNWSVRLGNCRGIDVRLHMLFFVFAACTFYLSWLAGREPAGGGMMWVGSLSVVILLASVALHEWGHCLAAIRMGATVDEVVLGPLGGLSPVGIPNAPRRELVVVLAGPLANLAVCLVCFVPLLSIDGVAALGLFHPLNPAGVTGGHEWLIALRLTFWINWVLALVNFLPAFPFDAGRAVQAAFAFFSPEATRQATIVAAARVAKIVAAILAIAGWVLCYAPSAGLVPPWFALVLLAIFLFFSARQEERRQLPQDLNEGPLGYDFSDGHPHFVRTDDAAEDFLPGPFSQWSDEQSEPQRSRREKIETEEEKRVDEILARLHHQGMENLSTEDRALLERVSARYRSRTKS